MSSLQGSKLDDQRGLLCREDLELPEFLKIQSVESPNNNNNNSTRLNGTYQSDRVSSHNYSDSVSSTSSSGHCSSTGQTGHRRSKSSDKERNLFVELNARPKSLTTFKPILKSQSKPKLESPKDSYSDDCDTTIIEDSNLDLDTTLVPLPTPPRVRLLSNDLPMPNYTPPTPLHRK